MSTWYKPPAIVSLFAEFNKLAPNRSKASDGTIGDQAHKDRSSDHNIDDGPDQGATPYEDADGTPEVHAADITAQLNKPGWTLQRAFEIIADRHRRGLDDRLQNLIINRRIASRSWGWTWRDYTGSDPHTGHGHASLRYTDAAERDVRPWGLLEADDVTKDECKAAVREVLREEATLDAIGDAVLQRKFPAPPGVPDTDGVWWYGTFDQESHKRLLELKEGLDALLARVPAPPAA